MWVKEDPADLNKDKGVSSELKKELSKFDDVYKAYDTLLYSVYKFDENEERNVDCFLHHLVLYGLERGGEFQKLLRDILATKFREILIMMEFLMLLFF